MKIPVIDLFAGPGGLGEGFSLFNPESPLHSWQHEQAKSFSIAASFEMDVFAHRTLTLRAFFRAFRSDPGRFCKQIRLYYKGCKTGEFSFVKKESRGFFKFLSDYFELDKIKDKDILEELLLEVGKKPSSLGYDREVSIKEDLHRFQRSCYYRDDEQESFLTKKNQEYLRFEQEQYTTQKEIFLRIKKSLPRECLPTVSGSGERPWVLIGGPPCQAYSVVGRSRVVGSQQQRDLRLQIAKLEAEIRPRVSNQPSLIPASENRPLDESPKTRKKTLNQVKEELEELRDELAEIKIMQRESHELDQRHFLFKAYVDILARFQPAYFVMENVKGLLSASHSKITEKSQRVFDAIMGDLKEPSKCTAFKDLQEVSYRILSFVSQDEDPKPRDFLIQSERFGVPQLRHRVILLGIRSDFYEQIRPFIKQLESRILRSPQEREFLKSIKREFTTTLKDAIGDLPEIRADISNKESPHQRDFHSWKEEIEKIRSICPEISPSHSEVSKLLEKISNKTLDPGIGQDFIPNSGQFKGDSSLSSWYYDPMLEGVLHHVARGHIFDDFRRYFFCSSYIEEKFKGNTITDELIRRNPSPKISEFPRALLPDHKNLSLDSSTGQISGRDFEDRFRVQVWDRPSTTITSHLSRDGHYFIHPDPLQVRSLTVRECARLQTFPDNYFFVGSRSQQYKQVGNAVPPLLAAQLAGVVFALNEMLEKEQSSQKNDEFQVEAAE
jgi:DNA (cytosine-5)-methyltransferase 1